MHPFCGMVAITFAVIQPIMAAFRPHPGEPRYLLKYSQNS